MNLDAQWIVGFVDGEGCFYVGINKNAKISIGYQVLPEFTVVQHQQDIQVLHALKAYFGCGVIRENHDARMVYRVRNIEHLDKIIVPFFMKHNLKTKKNINFKKFRKVLLLMQSNEHLTLDGIEKIRSIKNQMNRCLT